MRKSKILLSLGSGFLYIFLFAIGTSYAESAKQKGLSIATTVMKRDEGYGGFVAKAKMTLLNANGKASIRKLDIRNYGDSLLNTLII